MRTAEAGQPLGIKCRERFAGWLRIPIGDVQEKVLPKTEDQFGQWICADCGEPFGNNAQAQGHARDNPKHRLAWRGPTGELEAP